MADLNTVKDKLAKLVAEYKEKANILGQNEARTRQYLIDPFWEALGWDMRNPDHVDVESNVQADQLDLTEEEPTGTKRADYTFLHSYNKTAFVVEAKKPKVSLRDEKVINQLKRYGFTLGIDIGILHDFEEFRTFDTAFPVTPRPEVNLIKEFDIHYEQYPDLADKLLETFGREAVLGGSIQRLVGRVRKGKSTIPVDRHFLDMLKDWRKDLAIGLANQNPAYSIHDINEYVGRILNRIIFLRVVEERHALTGKPLEGAWNEYRRYADVGAKIKLYEQLKPFFLEMNEIFNGVLFKPTDWDEMKVPDPPVYEMLKEIYNPLVPYDFGVIPVELLGTIYERFLGEVVVREDDEVKIEVKPEVRKAGGVYYTPKYIVDYIVEQTVGKLIEGKTPEQIAKIKILDPACGSGSFLIGAYERLMKYHLEWFKKHPKKIKAGIGRADAYVDGDNNWRLGFHVKQQILVNNIFGVDIDERAVEVTMLSLYLKLMEDETFLTLEGMKYLPDLSGNIKCGNSLIGWDIQDMDILPTDPNERQAELERINPFDWEREFPEIFTPLNKGGQGGSGGFDAVIGNPPYVRQEGLGEQKKYFATRFESYAGSADLYTYFIERAQKILNDKGRFSYIVSNKWMRSNYGKALRKFLSKYYIEEIIDFGELPVFADAATFPMIMVIKKGEKGKTIYAPIKRLDFDSLQMEKERVGYALESSAMSETGFTLVRADTQAILEKIKDAGVPLGDYVEGKIYRGVLTGFNEAFIIDKARRDELIAEDPKSAEIIKPFVVGDDVRKYRINYRDRYLILTKIGVDIKRYPAIFKHLSQYKDKLVKRWDKGNYWWELRACAYYDEFEKPKIVWPDIAKESRFAFDEGDYHIEATVFLLPNNNKYLLGLLNSALVWFWLSNSCPVLGDQNKGGRLRLKTVYTNNLPIRTIDFTNADDVALHDRMVSLVEDMLALNKRLRETESPSTRKIIEAQIAHTDRTIDKLVYALYGLTEEEIKIVEASAK